MIRIGFVHFDGLHIIPHFVGSVAELYNDPECIVEILTPETDQEYLFSLLDLFNVPRTVVKKLPTYRYKKIAYKIQGREKPSNRFVFDKHKDLLMSYDLLVFNVFNHMHLNRKDRNPKFVMLMHGAGDRHYPFTPEYHDPISRFDLITTAGQKINDLFGKMDPFEHTQFEICGYQKLDVIKKQKRSKSFDNNNLTVLYNPHFKEEVSSFQKFGIEVLDFFYKNKDFNLIFAPHINLFNEQKKESLSRNLIDQKYFNTSNILIDFGSIKSVDMSYTSTADLYLGDVSSQIYEFLITDEKPCVFLNAHAVNWKGDEHYQNWNLGKVLDDLSDLKNILNSSQLWQSEFAERQKKAMQYTFNISTTKTSSKRVAEAIKKLIK